jgi:hypothetical protein
LPLLPNLLRRGSGQIDRTECPSENVRVLRIAMVRAVIPTAAQVGFSARLRIVAPTK